MKKSMLSICISLTMSMVLLQGTNTFAQSSSGGDCTELSEVHRDALAYFRNNMGEQKTKNTLFGASIYYDYKINLWKAINTALFEAVELGCNELVYTYVEADGLAEAEEVYNSLLNEFISCKPPGYIRVEHAESNYLQREHFIDERDKASFIFYKWPEYKLTISNVSGKYVVKFSILSKKFS